MTTPTPFLPHSATVAQDRQPLPRSGHPGWLQADTDSALPGRQVCTRLAATRGGGPPTRHFLPSLPLPRGRQHVAGGRIWGPDVAGLVDAGQLRTTPRCGESRRNVFVVARDATPDRINRMPKEHGHVIAAKDGMGSTMIGTRIVATPSRMSVVAAGRCPVWYSYRAHRHYQDCTGMHTAMERSTGDQRSIANDSMLNQQRGTEMPANPRITRAAEDDALDLAITTRGSRYEIQARRNHRNVRVMAGVLRVIESLARDGMITANTLGEYGDVLPLFASPVRAENDVEPAAAD